MKTNKFDLQEKNMVKRLNHMINMKNILCIGMDISIYQYLPNVNWIVIKKMLRTLLIDMIYTNVISSTEFKGKHFFYILSVYQDTTTNKQVKFSVVPKKATPVKVILWKHF
jgi:hypothetical protein